MNKELIANDNEFFSFFQDDAAEIFETAYQNRLLKVFIEDRQGWAQQISDILFPEHFDVYQKILINYQKEFFQKYKVAADYEDLRDIINDRERDAFVKEHLLGLVEKVREMELPHERRQVVQDRAYDFFKSKVVRIALIDIAKDWKKMNYDAMRKKLEEAITAGATRDSGIDYSKDYSLSLNEDFRNPISALEVLDNYINGGLSAGEFGVIVAPPGGGKSMALIKLACTALLEGKKIVYFTLELSKKVVNQRFHACLNNVCINDTLQFGRVIKESVQKYNYQLRIQEYPDGKASIATLDAYLQNLYSNEGFVPDEVFIDYADNMKAVHYYKENRDTLAGIYRDIRAMSIERQFPIWTASQGNRLSQGKDQIGLENISEAWGKAAIADVVVTISRTPAQLKDNGNKATFGIVKNRLGQVGHYEEYVFDTFRIYIRASCLDAQESGYKENLLGMEGGSMKFNETQLSLIGAQDIKIGY